FSVTGYSTPQHGTLAMNAAGDFTYTPSPDFNGQDTFTVDITDATGQTTTITVTLNIAPVNDAPTFNLSAAAGVPMNAGQVEIEGFLTDLSVGPENEAAQTFTITLTSDNPDLFAADGQPAIDAEGKLTFTPQYAGNALITVQVQDSGGTADGGVNTTTKTFSIDVSAPSYGSGSGGTSGGVYTNAVSSTVSFGPSIVAPGELKVEINGELLFSGSKAVSVGNNLPAATELRVELSVVRGALSAPTATSGESIVLTGTRQIVNQRLAQLKYEPTVWYPQKDLLAIRVFVTDPNGASVPPTIATVPIVVRQEVSLRAPATAQAVAHEEMTFEAWIDDVDDTFWGTLQVAWGDGTTSSAEFSQTENPTTLAATAKHAYETDGSYTQTWTLTSADGTLVRTTGVTVSHPAPTLTFQNIPDPDYVGEGAKGKYVGSVSYGGHDVSELTLTVTAGGQPQTVELDEDGHFEWEYSFNDDNPTNTDGDPLDVVFHLTDTAEDRSHTATSTLYLVNHSPFVVSDPFQEQLDHPQHRYVLAGTDGELSDPVYYETVAPVFEMPTFGDNPVDGLSVAVIEMPTSEEMRTPGGKYVRIEVTDDDGRTFVYEKSWTVVSESVNVEAAMAGLTEAYPGSRSIMTNVGSPGEPSYSATIGLESTSQQISQASFAYLDEGEPASSIDLNSIVKANAGVTTYREQEVTWDIRNASTYRTWCEFYDVGLSDVGYETLQSTQATTPQVRFVVTQHPLYDPEFNLSENGAVSYQQDPTVDGDSETYLADSFSYQVFAKVVTPDDVEHEELIYQGSFSFIGYTVTRQNKIEATIVDDVAAENILRADGTKAGQDANADSVVKNGAVLRFTRTQTVEYTYLYGMSGPPPEASGLKPPHEAVTSSKPKGEASVTFRLGAYDDAAVDSEDLEVDAATVTFAEGETVKDVVLKASYDELKERDEQVRIIITGSTGVADPLDAEDEEDDQEVGLVTVVDSDRIVAWGSSNVDAASTGLSRETVDINGRRVDLFDGRWNWQAPFGALPTFYSGVMSETFVTYDPASEAGGTSDDQFEHAVKRNDSWRSAQNDDHGTLLRPWLGISDVQSLAHNPNPTAQTQASGGYFGYVDYLIPVAQLQRDSSSLGAETWNGVLLVRRDGSTAWFDAKGTGTSLEGDTERTGQGAAAAEKRTFSGLVAGRYYYLQAAAGTSDLVAAGLYQADENGEIVLTANYRWYEKDNDGQWTYAAGVLSTATLYSDIEFTTPAGTFGTLSTGGGGEDRFELKLQNGTRFEFDDSGLLRAQFDRAGNETKFEYDQAEYRSQARLAKIILPTEGEIKLRYVSMASRELSSVTDAAGVSTYIREGQVFSAAPNSSGTDGSSSVISVGIGGPLRAAGASQTEINSVHIAAATTFLDDLKYDDAGVNRFRHIASGEIGRLEDAQITEAEKESRATYRRAYAVDEAAPPVWEYQFDRFGLITAKATPADSANPTEDVWQWERDVNGLVRKAKSPAGRGYTDGLESAPPEGAFDVVSYDYYSGTADLWKVTYFDIDGTTERAKEEWKYDPDKNHAIKEYKDQTGRIWKYDLNADGSVNYAEDPLGNRNYFGYTHASGGRPAGLMQWTLDAENKVTQYDYYTAADGAGRAGKVKSIKHGDGTPETRTETFQYDERGNLVRHVDVNNVARVYCYDRLGQLLEERVGGTVDLATGVLSGGVLVGRYTYDSAGNRRTVFLPAPDGVQGFVTTYEYDAWNRLKKITEPAAAGQYDVKPSTEFKYTADGLVEEVKTALVNNLTANITSAPKQTTTYLYNERRQQIAVIESGALEGVVSRATGAAFSDNTTTNYAYDSAGNLESVRDALGRTTFYTYDADGLLVRTKAPDPDGPTIQGSGDPSGTLSNFVTRTEYDAAGRKLKVFSPSPTDDPMTPDVEEVYTRYYYDAAGQLIRIQQPATAQEQGPALAKFVAYEYFGNGALKSERTGVTEGEPSDDGLESNGTSSSLDNVFLTMTYEYDALGREIGTTVSYAGATSGDMQTTTTYEILGGVLVVRATAAGQYDAAAGLGLLTGLLDYQTVTTYDVYGRVKSVKLPDPDKSPAGNGPLQAPVTWYDYYADGRLKSVTEGYVGGQDDPQNRVTTYTYDEAGRVRTTTVAGATTTITYDGLGRSVETRNADGTYATMQYNARGDLTRREQHDKSPTSGAAGQLVQSIEYAYDEVGAVIRATLNGVAKTTFAYDDLDRQVSQQTDYLDDNRAALDLTTTQYNAGGLVKHTDTGLLQTAYEYDALGRVIRQTETGDGTRVTKISYDDAARQQAVIDPQQNAVLITFDGLGRAVEERLLYAPAGSSSFQFLPGARTLKYDDRGLVEEVMDRNGRVTSYEYDALGRRIREEWVGGNYVATWSYDDLGRLIQAGDSRATYSYSDFDEQGRAGLVGIALDLALASGGELNLELDRTYRDQGVRDADSPQARASATITLARDGVALLTNYYLLDAAGHEVLARQTTPDGRDKQVVTGYTSLASTKTVTQSRFERFQGAYRAGVVTATTNLTAVGGEAHVVAHTQVGGPSAFNSTHEITYGYDEHRRMSGWTDYYGVQNLERDDRGLLTEEQRIANGQASQTTYAPDVAGNATNDGRVLEAHNRVDRDQDFDYTYDAEGNVTEKTALRTQVGQFTFGDKWSYAYDHRNRLTSMVRVTAETDVRTDVKLYYDVFDRVVAKHTLTLESQNVDRWEYTVSEERRVLAHFTANGAAAPELSQRDFYNAGGALLAWETTADGAVFWPLVDGEGSTVAVVRLYADGYNDVETYAYSGTGHFFADSTSLRAAPTMFAGRTYDVDLGLYLYDGRAYDAKQGRFLSEVSAAPGANRYLNADTRANSAEVSLTPNPTSPAESGKSLVGRFALGAGKSALTWGAILGIGALAHLNPATAALFWTTIGISAMSGYLSNRDERLAAGQTDGQAARGALLDTVGVGNLFRAADYDPGTLEKQNYGLGDRAEFAGGGIVDALGLASLAKTFMNGGRRFVGNSAKPASSDAAAAALARGIADEVAELRAIGAHNRGAAAEAFHARINARVAPTTAEVIARRNGFHVEAPTLGLLRPEQRAGANWNLLQRLEADPAFARQLGKQLGVDDIAGHMRSGKLGLRNPPGTEWHHPIDDPNVMWLLRREVHRAPDLQQILHPDNIGGFGTHFGN
ncbi:MAG: cadherin-like domain-containing protein, partial [Planctomycetes bacterium]|nr:cadherin-like domain-containing protein [Planctomycetota bacterium]